MPATTLSINLPLLGVSTAVLTGISSTPALRSLFAMPLRLFTGSTISASIALVCGCAILFFWTIWASTGSATTAFEVLPFFRLLMPLPASPIAPAITPPPKAPPFAPSKALASASCKLPPSHRVFTSAPVAPAAAPLPIPPISCEPPILPTGPPTLPSLPSAPAAPEPAAPDRAPIVAFLPALFQFTSLFSLDAALYSSPMPTRAPPAILATTPAPPGSAMPTVSIVLSACPLAMFKSTSRTLPTLLSYISRLCFSLSCVFWLEPLISFQKSSLALPEFAASE